MVSALLGVPQLDRALFRDWSTTIVSPPESGERGAAAAKAARYFTELIESKRRNPTEDLFSSLVHTDIDGDRRTDTELVSMAFLLMVAGHETGVNAVADGMHALLRPTGTTGGRDRVHPPPGPVPGRSSWQRHRSSCGGAATP